MHEPRQWGPQGNGPSAPSTPRPLDELRMKHLKRLGLKPGASMEEIKGAWRRLAVKHHPDRAPEHRKASAEKKMREINEAYQWLLANSAEAA